jgi:phosphonate transport system substrate-binding protein
MREIIMGKWVVLPLLAMTSVLSSCGGDEQHPVFTVAGIPDQNSSDLARRYKEFTKYLSQSLQQEVKYVPTVNYSATVTGFKQGEIHMAWFGGLTGVMARMHVADALAIVQRPADENSHSVL